MLIGLTYDLRDDYLARGYTQEETAEMDSEETIAAIERTLQELEHNTDRIGGVASLVVRLAAGDSWDLVFNICEGFSGLSREAQVPALLDAYAIPYTFSDPLVLTVTLHKGMAKRIVRDLGVATPDFVVAESLDDIAKVDLPFPLFLKPVAEGTSKGITASSVITDRDQLVQVGSALLEAYRQPVLIETYLPGREFTVGIVGTAKNARVVGVMECVFQPEADAVYSYWTKQNYETAVRYRIPDTETAKQCEEIALKIWNGLGCRDGGRVDLRMDAQQIPNFMEVNPLAGLNPVSSDLPIAARLNGIEYEQLLAMIMESALQRVRSTKARV